MFHEFHPELLRQVAAERQENLRRAVYVARLRRVARVQASERRRRRRARRRERRPQLAAPPPALAE